MSEYIAFASLKGQETKEEGEKTKKGAEEAEKGNRYSK